MLATIEAQIEAIDADAEALFQDHAPLRQAVETLTSVTGIGRSVAVSLLALLPQLGSLGRWRIALLTGRAPHPNQSRCTDAYRRGLAGGRQAAVHGRFVRRRVS